LDWEPQPQTLVKVAKEGAWICTLKITTQVPGDTQARERILVTLETFLLLFTMISINRVDEQDRGVLGWTKRDPVRTIFSSR